MPALRRDVVLYCLAWLSAGYLAVAASALGGGYVSEHAQRGYHILIWEEKDCTILAWKDSLRSAEPLRIPFEKGWTGSCNPGLQQIKQQVEEKLRVPPRQKYQQPIRYFTTQGEEVSDDRGWNKAVAAGPVFLIEGGQFQWPPVSVGFRQQVEGLTNNGAQIELETLSVRPPIFSVRNLASAEETAELIKYAKPYFHKADVVYMDHDKGKPAEDFRVSLHHRPSHNETPLVAKMEARCSALTKIPPSHFEEPQILQYKIGGFYHAHDDAAQLQFYSKDRGQIRTHHYGYFDRMATVFWYMNTVTKGGHTNFPRAHAGPSPHTMTKCVQGIMVPPEQGMAVMWYNMEPYGIVDPYALHAACPVEEGEKYAINIWVYNKPKMTPPAKWEPKHPRLKEIGAGDTEDTDVSIDLANEAETDVAFYWDGPPETFMAQLEPGRHQSMNTFPGHSFTAKSLSGEVLGHHKVTAKPRQQRLVITRSKEL